MTKFSLAGAAILALSTALAAEVHAQDLQPGMRTMVQRGGAEGLPLVPAPLDDLDDSKLQPGMRTMIQRGGAEGVRLGALFPSGAHEAYETPAYDTPAHDPTPAYGTRRDPTREVVRVRN